MAGGKFKLPDWWPWAAIGLAVLLSGGFVLYKVRGLRNNNPGNLKKDGTQWSGLASAQTDSTFFQFLSPIWGLRALARVLLNYQTEHGLDTVQDIINRWAPPGENNTGEYVQNVADAMGVSPTAQLDLVNNREQLTAMMAAITQHENGLNPYKDSLLNEAADLAQA